MKRSLAVTFLVGAGIGLSGCQSAGLGGLAIWNRDNAAMGSTAPDVNKQKFAGLSQQFGDQRGDAGSVGIGGPRSSDDGFFAASWKKTTAAVGAMAATPKIIAPEDDPTRLDTMPKKIGPEVYIGAARLMENQGKFAEAEDKYREALKAAPNDVNALVGLARLYDRQGQGQKAIETYHKASQANPASGLVFNDVGMCFRRQRQLDKAIIAFRKAVELTPDNAKYRNNLATALVDAGRNDEAYKEFAATNSAGVAHFNLASLLQQKGQPAEAERHLREAIAVEPGMVPAREMLAQMNAAPAPAARAEQALAQQTLAEQPAPRMALQTSVEPNPAYVAGAAEDSYYTGAPQTESFAAAAPAPARTQPQSYHIGDDAPAAEMAQRSKWSSASWAVSKPSKASGSQPLPPTD